MSIHMTAILHPAKDEPISQGLACAAFAGAVTLAPGTYVVNNRPGYIQCIAQGAPWLAQSWCEITGRSVYFQSLDHAAYAIKNESRLVPCPECLEAARKQLTMP